MTAYTNATSVVNLTGTKLSAAVIAELIADAHLIVVETLGDAGLSTDRLTLIEKYLAAHYVSLRDDSLRLESEKTGQSGAVFGVSSPMRFRVAAIAMDPTGRLKSFLGPDGFVAEFSAVSTTRRSFTHVDT